MGFDYWICLFYFIQFLGGNHPQEDLAKFGYKPKDNN
jgi:hypothetical protein